MITYGLVSHLGVQGSRCTVLGENFCELEKFEQFSKDYWVFIFFQFVVHGDPLNRCLLNCTGVNFSYQNVLSGVVAKK